MKRRQLIATPGLIILVGYLIVVIGLEITRAVTGWPFEQWLASSPSLLAHGQWWRLVTSAFVIDGSPAPQIAITAVLGGLIIWLRGSWLFWGVTAAAHLLGTLVTYVIVIVTTSVHGRHFYHFLMAPDYGISLVWSSALGVVAAAAWLGPTKTWRHLYRPAVTVGSFGIMVVVIVLSKGDDALQHAIAFVVGALLLIILDRDASVSRTPALRGSN